MRIDRLSPTRRCLLMLTILGRERVSLGDLARRVGVSTRTVRRYLIACEQLGLVLEVTERESGRGSPVKLYTLDRASWLELLDVDVS